MLVVTMIFGLIMSDITTTTVEAATFTTTTTLKNGSTGTQVKYLQYGLVGWGYLKGSVDGKYGTATQTAVKN